MKRFRRFQLLAATLFIGASSLVLRADSGTRLTTTITNIDASADCVDGRRLVAVDFSVTSSAAADAAALTVQINGGDETLFGQILSGNVTGGWTFAGRTKTYSGETTINLEPGTYEIALCATQSGSDGRIVKRSCDTRQVVVEACSQVIPANCTGEVIGQLDTSNGNAFCNAGTLNITWRGAASWPTTVNVTVTDGGTTLLAPTAMSKDGDSCNYRYQWTNPPARSGNTTWTFTVTNPNDNAVLSSFNATGNCTHPDPH
jgi:hypothetical protein